MSSTRVGGFHCPFRGFHCCPDGRDESKGFARLVAHITRLHLCDDERRRLMREAIESDLCLFLAVEESLKVLRQWLCGKCMSIHAVSRTCHHSDGSDNSICVTSTAGVVESHIVGILKPSIKVLDTLDVKEELVLNTGLLERIFQVLILTVKSIPHSCRLAFSQALKETLYKVIATPDSIGAWVQLLLLPRCTLQVVKPQTRRDRREPDGLDNLVDNVLNNYGQGSLGYGSDNIADEKFMKKTNIKQCLRKVADVHFTAAVKVLGSSGIAPYNEATMKVLGEKHPHKPHPSAPTTMLVEAPLSVEVDYVLRCIQSFPKGT
ncbi:hypothetical protein A2U01_0008433 [Trifolium medium]|uniref:Uncharacterized protein n=1 Tax=Trifolium medium TaxID=97028 RepID=A0A392MJ76_9FABA|nr:hypothetical protein [Trifolium medium]